MNFVLIVFQPFRKQPLSCVLVELKKQRIMFQQRIVFQEMQQRCDDRRCKPTEHVLKHCSRIQQKNIYHRYVKIQQMPIDIRCCSMRDVQKRRSDQRQARRRL